jgi:Dehydrogenases with different specificities (related to short-chain alcohol dehydrogenases)
VTSQFHGKVALVTGAASGIGRASALAFAREGARVVVADIQVAGGEETAQTITSMGGEALFIKADISKAAEVEELIQQTVAHYGRLDFAHNNAALKVLLHLPLIIQKMTGIAPSPRISRERGSV